MELAQAPTGPLEPTLEEGALLGGRFRLGQEVGGSERGCVYSARDERDESTVAVRILPPVLASDPDYLARVRRSVLVAHRVAHPNVCRVIDVEQCGALAYVSMEWVGGERLKDILARRRLTPAEARRLLMEICAGVAAVHDQGAAHGDLRSSNVIVTEEGAQVMDFGLSCVVAEPEPSARCALAPDSSPGAPTPAGDVYALGVLAYRMLTGRRLARVPGAEDSMADVPAPLRDFVRGCLCPDPTQRYANAGELVRALEQTERRVSFVALERVDARLVGVVSTALGFALGWALLAAG
jgi:serine/threonine protein kinase